MNRAPTHPDFIAAALDLVGMPACACDSGGTVLAANAALARLLGVDPAGRALGDFFPPEHQAFGARQLRAAGAAEQRWDSSLLDAAGAAIAVQVWAKPLPAGAGPRGATVLFNDVSVHQRDQMALR
jgi:PAS domain-containing protein